MSDFIPINYYTRIPIYTVSDLMVSSSIPLYYSLRKLYSSCEYLSIGWCEHVVGTWYSHNIHCIPFIFHSMSTAHVHCSLPNQHAERAPAHNHAINQWTCQTILPVRKGEKRTKWKVPGYTERQNRLTDRKTDRLTDLLDEVALVAI